MFKVLANKDKQIKNTYCQLNWVNGMDKYLGKVYDTDRLQKVQLDDDLWYYMIDEYYFLVDTFDDVNTKIFNMEGLKMGKDEKIGSKIGELEDFDADLPF